MDTFKMNFNKKIDSWDEGLPLGNGEMGCIIYGGNNQIIFSLDRGDVWDRTDSPEKTEGFNFANLIKLKESGKAREIHRIFDKPYNKPTPTKLPMGKLVLKLKGNGQQNNFNLDISIAEASFGNGENNVQCFLHSNEKVGLIKTDSNAEIELINPKFGQKSKWDNFTKFFTASKGVCNKLKNVKYPKAEFNTEKNGEICVKYYLQQLNDDSCYGVAVASKKTGNGIEYAFFAYFSKEKNKLKEELTNKVIKAVEIGYDKMFISHKKWWAEYHAKSNIILPDKFVEKCYNIGNYLLGSASRVGQYPMPLQGLWTACDDVYLPPWKGDYHHDLNTQMSHYSYLKSNHLEQGKSFIDFLIKLTDRAKEFANNFYNADGLCLPSVMDIDGYACGGWAMYSLSPTNQIWLCQIVERHYIYTGDNEFLVSTAFPYIKETAKFIKSLLKEGKDGKYVLPISSSPELHDNSLKSFITPNSNYDLSLMRYLFATMVKLSKVVGEDASQWQKVLNGLAELAVNANNVLKVSVDEDINESHRHQSHAMSIHPLRLLDYAKTKDKLIIDATIDRAVKLGTKHYVGYSFTWIAEFFTIAKNGDKALEYLTLFWKYFCLQNTFHINGDYTKQGYTELTYRPFTLEGNFCALDVVQEMLLYSEDNIIEIFPALPSAWRDVEFNNLRACGGLLVSANLSNGMFTKISIVAEQNISFVLRNKLSAHTFEGGKCDIMNDCVNIRLCKGEKMNIVL